MIFFKNEPRKNCVKPNYTTNQYFKITLNRLTFINIEGDLDRFEENVSNQEKNRTTTNLREY